MCRFPIFHLGLYLDAIWACFRRSGGVRLRQYRLDRWGVEISLNMTSKSPTCRLVRRRRYLTGTNDYRVPSPRSEVSVATRNGIHPSSVVFQILQMLHLARASKRLTPQSTSSQTRRTSLPPWSTTPLHRPSRGKCRSCLAMLL